MIGKIILLKELANGSRGSWHSRRKILSFTLSVMYFQQYFQLLTDTKLLPRLKYYNINIFFFKTVNLIINNWLLFSYTICNTERISSPFDEISRQEDKNLNF